MFEKKDLAKAYKRFMDSEDGRLILADILKFSGYNNASYVEGKPDATAYNEGKKSYARRVLTLMNFSQEDGKKIRSEYKKLINKK